MTVLSPRKLALLSLSLLGTACEGSPAAANDSCAGLPTAPRSARVDLARPTFPDPTTVTNPLFPVSALHRVLLMGASEGVPLRVETTLLPSTRTIRVDGREIEVLQSQYVAWLDRRLHEVAIDWYAQDATGAVWYLGEDVFNYAGGVVEDTDGTWLAGRDGPAAMIMAASPQVGDVWRPENVCDVVFEEVSVTDLGLSVPGPRGTVTGAILTSELHMDGTFEQKIFAPGYGEFSTGAGANLEAVALAVPTDALGGALPGELAAISAAARRLFEEAAAEDWAAADVSRDAIASAWATIAAGALPPMLQGQMTSAITALDDAVASQLAVAARQASIAIDQGSLDLQLRHRTVEQVDLELLDLWARQLLLDAGVADVASVLGDAATITWIRERLATDVRFEPELSLADAAIARLSAAAATRDLSGMVMSAGQLRRALRTR